MGRLLAKLCMKSWDLCLHQCVIDQDKYPVHILPYNTLKEIQNTLDYLNVSYDIETIEENLREDYSEFHRPHVTADFEMATETGVEVSTAGGN